MRDRLAFALDYPTLAEAEAGAARVAEVVGVLKVGLELFVAEGPAAVRLGAKLGCKVFRKPSSGPSPRRASSERLI
jgi:orotidine-5'-phosphate decarboxylase